MPSGTRRNALLLLIAVSSVAGWLGRRHLDNEIDVGNHALKSQGSVEAADLELLRASFGDERRMLLAWSVATGLRIEPAEAGSVREIAAVMRTHADLVAEVGEPPIVDGQLACLVVRLTSDADDTAPERVWTIARELTPPTLTLRATAPQLAEREIAGALAGERSRVVPLVGGVLFLLLWFAYRRLTVAVVVLAPAGASIAITGGLFATLGHRIDPIATLLDPVLLTVGVATGIHLVESYARRADPAAVRAELANPIGWTTATTAVGFLAVSRSELPAVAAFGSWAAFGVALVTALSFVAVPLWLDACRVRVRGGLPVERGGSTRIRGLERASFGLLVATAAIVVLAAVGLGRLSIDNHPIRLLPPDGPFRSDHDWLTRQLGGVETASLMIPAESDANQPEWIALLVADLLDRPGVVGRAGPGRVDDAGNVAIPVTIAPDGSAGRLRLFDAVDAHAADLGFTGVRVVGDPVQVARDSDRLIRGQLAGLAVLVPVLGLVIAIGLRSWRLGLLAIVPNVVPVIVLYGVLGWIGRPLTVATVMIGSAMMGLVVDDTIHLLHGYATARRAGADPRTALAAALTHCGRAITVTSIVLGVGLGAGAVGELRTTVEFSVMAAATVALAWFLDLAVLPAFLLRFATERTPGPAEPSACGIRACTSPTMS